MVILFPCIRKYAYISSIFEYLFGLSCAYVVQSHLVIINFLVTLKLFLNSKCSLSLWSKLANWSQEMVPIHQFVPYKPFLITKFEYIKILTNSLTFGYSIENNKRSLIDLWMICLVKYTHYLSCIGNIYKQWFFQPVEVLKK